ncbi:hypothetical protein [Pseudomonas urmiensis]|uniref:Uncharacterized protein n=1 Tax=Pseudomonas urmiensis TaxID=2745493 RepID=A0A923FY20_9PSED|nr:hypothetical protein [Pseudomonas urmiensis]MBV4536878.1 hypothetical protein [Pseudomonas urmiensis]
MTVEWAFFILASMLVVSGAVLAWGAALARKRSYEEFILRKSKRVGGGE